MPLTVNRAADFLAPRLWYGLAAGGFVWVAWAAGIVFADSDVARGDIRVGTGYVDLAGNVVGVDHLAFYSAARKIRDGRSGDVYDNVEMGAYQATLIPDGRFAGKLEAVRNPPFFPLLYLPTAGLDYAKSVAVWTAVGWACLAAGVWLVSPERPLRALAWALTFLPTFAVTGYGQTSDLSLVAFAGCYRLLAAGHAATAGLVAALLWLKPPLLMGLVVWWLFDWRRYWPALAVLAAGGAGLFAATLPVVPDGWHQFVATLRQNAEFDGFEWWKSHNARAFWRLLLTPEAAPLPALVWLPSAASAVWLFGRVWRANRDSVPVVFAAAVYLTLWASPHTMLYEWAAAVLPAILLWHHRPESRRLWVVLFAAVWAALFVSTDFAHFQEIALRRLTGYESVPLIQVSVPVTAWAGWRAARRLASGPPPA